MTFYSPLRYPGGKNCIYQFVSKLFIENELLGISYAEPYAGGAGLALRLLFEEYVDCIYINDLDRAIFAFWKAVIDHNDEFCDWVAKVDVSMNSWYAYRKIHQNRENEDLFELAKATFFLNRTNVSGVIKGGVIGGYKQLGKYKMDARFNKNDLIKRIRKIGRFKNRIIVSNYDGLQFIQDLDKKRENVFIYLDPPYYKKGADLYMNSHSDGDHAALSEYVNNMELKWMVSYDNQEFIINLYDNQRKLIHKLSQSTSNRVGDEILIFSDDISFSDSIAELKDPVLI